MKRDHNCNCEWCTKTSPLLEKIHSLLTNENDIKHLDKIMNDLIHAETDAVYWEAKYKGTWPSDGFDEIQHHIQILSQRLEELKQ